MDWIDIAALALKLGFYLGLAAVLGWVIVNVLKIWHSRGE